MALNIPTTIDNITKDTKLAVMNFINVLKRIPAMIENTGNLTVEQPPKKDRKRQNEIKKAGSNLRPFLKEQASEPHVCLCSFQTPSPYMEK